MKKEQYANFHNAHVAMCSLCGGIVKADIVSNSVKSFEPDWDTAKCTQCGAVAADSYKPQVVAMKKVD